MAPPYGLTRASSSAMPKCSRKASTCTANASLTSNAPMSSMVRPACLRAFSVAGIGPAPITSGSTPDVGVGHQPHLDRQAQLLRGLLVGEQRRGRAVVDARGVAGGHLAVRAERRLQRRQRLHRGAGTHRLVGRGQAPAELGRPGGDGDQVGLDLAGVVRRGGLLLGADGVGVDALLGDRRVAVVQVLGGLAHHERVGVDDPLGQDPRVGVDALAHRVPAHVLDAAGDGDVVRAEGDAGGGGGHGGHRAGAHPVDREAGHALRQAGQQRGGAADGQALVADLGGRGDGHLVDALGRQRRVAPHELTDALDDEVVGAGLGVLAVGLADTERGAYAVDEDDLSQLSGLMPSWGVSSKG